MICFEVGKIYYTHHVTDSGDGFYFKVIKRNAKSIRFIEVEKDGSNIPGEEPFTAKLYSDTCEYVMISGIEIDNSKRELLANDQI